MNYILFDRNRYSNGIAYHLSKANDESFYFLYDMDPTTPMNSLRFCRKPDPQQAIQVSPSCDAKSCTSNCLNITMEKQIFDERFGFYSCSPKTSLVGIVYTQSFPVKGDFIRPNLPMDYAVFVRRNATDSLSLSFQQLSNDTSTSCYEYINFDRTSPSNDIVTLNCNLVNSNNRTMNSIRLKEKSNGLVTVALADRRMSGHHFRFIDYQISKSIFTKNEKSKDSFCFLFAKAMVDAGTKVFIIRMSINASARRDTTVRNVNTVSSIERIHRFNSFFFSACPPGYYGQTCDFACHGDDDYCKGLLICLPDPYGCSCYTGWYGAYCNLGKS